MTFSAQFATRFCLILMAIVLASCKTPGTSSLTPHLTKSLQYEPAEVKLKGRIVKETFPGKPNYESVAKGDEPENYWLLYLDKPVDIAAGSDEMSPAETNVQKIQLVLGEGDYEKYRNLLYQTVSVTGTLFHQVTVHHKTAVLIEVRGMEPASGQK